jgi:hypothetical protein
MITSFAGGLGASYTFISSYNVKKEIEQGGNQYLASAFLAGEVAALGTVISYIAECVIEDSFTNLGVNILCNVIPIVTIPIALFCAVVKNNDYTYYRNRLDNYLAEEKEKEGIKGLTAGFTHRIIQIFPSELNVFAKEILDSITEHNDTVMLAAMVAGTVALFALEQYAFVIACSTSLAYNFIDRAGWIPNNISLFVESYSPSISILGSFLGGTFIVRVLTASWLVNSMSPIKWFVYEKIDLISCTIFRINSPSLQEYNADWKQERELSNDKIWEILDAGWEDFEINPAHCTKSIVNECLLPTDDDLSQFISLFDTVNWSTQYAVIKPMLADDDKFQEYIQEKFPAIKQIANEDERIDKIKLDFDAYMIELAKKEIPEEANQTKEHFAAKWVRDQIVELDKILTGKKRVEGLQSDLEEAMKDLGKILADLKSLQKNNELVAFQDNLLKIAIEGGDYCALGIKRMSREMMVDLLYKIPMEANKTHTEKNEENDPFEMQLKQKLLFERVRVVQSMYQFLKSGLPNSIGKDIHSFDIYRPFLSIHMLPLTISDKYNFSIEDLINSISNNVISQYFTGNSIRNNMFEIYKWEIPAIIREVGEIHVSNFLVQMINKNSALSDLQREKIIEYISMPQPHLSYEDYNTKLHQLMLVVLGVLKMPSQPK